MHQRPLGQTGIDVSSIGLGCMGMSEFYGVRDDARSLETLRAAVAHSINFVDTADIYGFGHNEELIGRFLREGGGKVVVATKFGIVRKPGAYERRIDNSPAYVAQSCDASLKRLGVETIDLYYCHRRNPDIPIEDMIGAMADLVSAGKVRALGLSEVSPDTLRRAHAVHPIAALQSEYSLWTRDPEGEILDTCRDLGITFVAYSPLGRAFLPGAIGNPADLPADDFRRFNPRFSDEAFAQNQRLADSLSTFAKARSVRPAQIALAWLLTKHEHVVPIPGTKRPTYLAENAAAADLKLSATEIGELDALFAPGTIVGGRYSEAGMVGIEA